jgi:two-component system response regulator
MNKPGDILMIEDNADDFEAAQRSFTKNHFLNPVIWCRDGQEGLDYLASFESRVGKPG